MTTRYQQALQAYAEGRYEDAMQQFSELLYEDPRNPKLHIWLGATFRKAGKIEYARVQYQQVLTLTDDPDLLDIARTSLAQIQNNAVEAIASDTTGSTSGNLNTTSGSLNSIGDTSGNGLVEIANFADEQELLEDPDTTQLAPMTNNNMSGGAIPPPGSTAGANNHNQATFQSPISQQPSSLAHQNGSHAGSIATNRTNRTNRTNSNDNTAHQLKPSAPRPSNVSKSSSSRAGRPPTKQIPQKSDTLRPSSLKQRFVFSAIAIVAVTVATIGFIAYRNNQAKGIAIAQKTNETQQLKATNLASKVGGFVQQQSQSTQMLGNLMSSSNLLPNKPLTAGQKQWLQGRLNLYNQAFSSFDNIALFDVKGNLITQAQGSVGTATIDPAQLAQIVATPTNTPLLGELIETEQGYAVTFTTAIVNPNAKQVALVLRVQMPVAALDSFIAKIEDLNQYAVVDANGNYVVAEGLGTTGTSATATYPELAQLQAANQVNVNGITSATKAIAFAPTPALAELPDLNWAVLISADRNTLISSDNFITALIIASLAAIVVVGAISAIASKNITDPLKQASAALRELANGNFDIKLKERSRDEIGILSANINDLAREFKSLIQRQKQEKEHLHQQVLKLFKALQKLAGVDAGDIQISGDSLSLIVNRIETNLVQKEAEANRQRQEKEKLQQHLITVLSDVRELARGDLSVRAKAADGDMKSVSDFFNAVIAGAAKDRGQLQRYYYPDRSIDRPKSSCCSATYR
jgi:methyl-accepting chemotaxis protein